MVSPTDAGNFRWIVEVLNHVVFAEPTNRAARDLAADAMEQLGYQAESATWRNSYLLAARELRSTSSASTPRGVSISPDVGPAFAALLVFDGELQARFTSPPRLALVGPRSRRCCVRW
jgi:alkyl sulfatase BDS1-like metallo-beta-lactamase superfamily hydrolase